MVVTVLDTLDREELVRYRAASASIALAQTFGHGLTGEEIRQCWLDYYELCDELLQNHRFDSEDAIEAKISPYTGAIYTSPDGVGG